MTTEVVTETIVADATAHSNSAEGMHRFYDLAKRQAWDIRGLSWGESHRAGGERLPRPSARGDTRCGAPS